MQLYVCFISYARNKYDFEFDGPKATVQSLPSPATKTRTISSIQLSFQTSKPIHKHPFNQSGGFSLRDQQPVILETQDGLLVISLTNVTALAQEGRYAATDITDEIFYIYRI